MEKRFLIWSGVVVFFFQFTSCGDENAASVDTTTDDAVPADGQDGQEEVDVPSELPDDVQSEEENACTQEGGYCSGYAPIPPHCILCDSNVTHYMPAPPDQGAMGCIFEGVGASPWCCLPRYGAGSTQCETSGGECYPSGSGGEDPCPPGWIMSRALCGEDQMCCVPGSDCSGH